jgi:hypothetical protein
VRVSVFFTSIRLLIFYQVNVEALAYNAEQRHSVSRIYGSNEETCHHFSKDHFKDQRRAQVLLLELGLSRETRHQLEGRWSVQWSNGWEVGKFGDERRRILFQWYLFAWNPIRKYDLNPFMPSVCGYDHIAKQQHQHRKGSDVSTMKQWTRRVPYDFTGCLAHVEITERLSDGEITRIIGCFTHNSECNNSLLKRIPAVPLHEHVYEIAIEQLRNGATFVLQFGTFTLKLFLIKYYLVSLLSNDGIAT